MKTHQLRAFLAVHEAGSLQAAAAQLHVTQPALSKSIKELENQFGVSLISIVTPRREIMTESAGNLFRILNETMRARYPEFS